MANTKIAVLGAGPVGALCAIFLAKRGHKVELYEKRSDLRKKNLAAGRSINLALANRGISALNKINIFDAIRPILIPMRGRFVHDETVSEPFQPYGHKSSDVIYSVSRNKLNRILLDIAERSGVDIHFDHDITKVDLDTKTLKLNACGESKTVSFDRIIGADGAGSILRSTLLEKSSLQNTVEQLGHSYKELTILPGPDGQFKMEKQALHIWPRGNFMLIALPNLDGSFTLTLFMPQKGPVSFESLDTKAKVTEFFEQTFPDTIELIDRLEESFFENPTSRLATMRCKPWHFEDKALLIGDAAHAIVPFHGQGMNCGFEDCEYLDELLAEHQNFHTIFEAFEIERKKNADAIADMALDNYIEMRDRVRDPEFIESRQIALALSERFGDAFMPRYSMVMFETLPYCEAQRKGEIQKDILSILAKRRLKDHSLDWDLAEKLISQRL